MSTQTSTPHTPEPWKVYQPRVKQYIKNGADHFVLEPSQYGWRNPADAHRAVACVNACTGMADPEATITALREACKQADYAFRVPAGTRVDDEVKALGMIRAALALVEKP